MTIYKAQSPRSGGENVTTKQRENMNILNQFGKRVLPLLTLKRHTPQRSIKNPCGRRCIMTAHINLTASTYGIVQASFWNIDADTIKTAQDAIIDDLKALVRHGRAQLHHGSYTPQFLPIVWVIGLEGSEPLDFGVMIDAVACDESTIDRRADEIIAKLCRDCQMIGGLV